MTPMEKKPSPYQRAVFVCTHSRGEGARISCANPGRDGEKICEALKHAVKEAGLKGRVRVARSGCLDLCEQGPNALVYPDGEWLSGMSLADVPGLVKKLAEPRP